MQSANWYFKRLQGMTPSEVAWRVTSLIRDWFDCIRIPLGLLPNIRPADSECLASFSPGFELLRTQTDFEIADSDGTWLKTLLPKANAIESNRLSFFDHADVDLGNPIDWHRDHRAEKSTSRSLIQFIDYRDFSRNGDCKEVWEPNRHHQLVVLARAYSATGEVRYAKQLVRQLIGWIEQNPFGYGMNWRSPLELGVRIINWVVALELIRPSGVLEGKEWDRIYSYAYLHCWEIARKLSRGSSANNHLVGELAGLFVGSSYFSEMPNSEDWKHLAKSSLEDELLKQTFDDGCNREQALGYQFFVLQFYVICGVVGSNGNCSFSQQYWNRISSMIHFVAALSEYGPLPMFGDQDDGYVLNLGDAPDDVEAWLNIAAHLGLHESADDLPLPSHSCESAYWLLNSQPSRALGAIDPDSRRTYARPMECGYTLLQANNQEHEVSILFDSADLGYGNIAAHGHADALSFSLRADKRYLLIDPGTYDYFSFPEYRNYFRSTAAHNTVRVDSADQSTMLGPFLWGHRAKCTPARLTESEHEISVASEHDGYSRLPDPVTHRREIELNKSTLSATVIDEIVADREHDIEVFFHLGPDCTVERTDQNVITINIGTSDRMELHMDPALSLQTLTGSEDPIAGWYSAGYHQKEPITTVIGTCRTNGRKKLIHQIVLVWSN